MDPNQTTLFRVRFTYTKQAALRYTGHLDLHRAWERTLRRARLPIAYSQGFNPTPRIQIAAALPLGFTSREEVIDMWFERELPLDDLFQTVQANAQPGITLLKIEPVELRAPALQTQVTSSEYQVELIGEPLPDLAERVDNLLAQTNLLRTWRDKPYDLRPLIEGLRLTETGRQGLWMQLSSRAGATGRPEEVLAALSIPLEDTRVERIHLAFAEAG